MHESGADQGPAAPRVEKKKPVSPCGAYRLTGFQRRRRRRRETAHLESIVQWRDAQSPLRMEKIRFAYVLRHQWVVN